MVAEPRHSDRHPSATDGLTSSVRGPRGPSAHAARVAPMQTHPSTAVPHRSAIIAPTEGSGRERSSRPFWILAVVGLVVMSAAWSLFGLAFEEEMTEQPKSLSAGSTMAGFGSLFGTAPLVVAHASGLVILSIVAVRGRARPWAGFATALATVLVVSAIGLLTAQILWAGQLFAMGVGAPGLTPPG